MDYAAVGRRLLPVRRTVVWEDGAVATVESDYEGRARAIWEAYARGGGETMCALLDDDVVWRPSSGAVLHGAAEIAEYLERHASAVTAVAHVYERHGDCVLVHGSLRRFLDGGFLDMQPSWVFFFRAGRLLGATAYATRSEAMAAIEAHG
jgi:ketosteroid isomerase-like protein